MNCTINDLQLSFDSNGKLRTTIGRVTGFDVNKAYVLASFLRDPNFQKYLLEKITQEDIIKNTTVDFKNFTEKDYVNIKQNKLGAILNLYYIEKYHSVNNSKTNKGMGRLNGFTSATAKKTAINHVAFILRREYNKEINKDKASRRSAAQIIDSVNAELLKDFYEKYVNPFVELIVSSSNYSKEAKEYAAKYLRIKSEIEAINEIIKRNQILADSYNEQIKKLKDIEEINKLRQQRKELYNTQVTKLNRGRQLTIDRYIIAQNLVNLHSSNYDGKVKDRIRNFANLVAQSRGDMNGWYFQVFHSKIMIDAYKFFNSLGDVETAVNSLEVNEDEIVDTEDDQGINQYAKHWEDKFYKSAEESVNAALRMELANLPVLKEPYNPSAKEQAIDTNNELGVATYMNPQFVIAQIHSSSKVYSVEAFIRSLDELSKTKSSLYGLGALVDKMKRNKAYANFVYVNFAKPIFNKTIVTVNTLSEEAGIKFDYSNPNIAPLTELVFRMSNKLKASYDITYSAKDRQDLIEIQKKLINNTLDRDKDIESVYNILTNYFPNFDKKSFTQYIDNISKGDFKTEFNAFISYLSDIIKGVGELKIKINNELIEHQQKQQKIFEDYLNVVRYAELKKSALPEKPEREPFKSKDDDLSADTYKAIIALANAFINFTDSKIRLTSSNAEGNTAADIGKNCYISRFFEQILAEDETNANKGLENLLSYITQGVDNGETNQYANNPLFFGVRDENGVEIVPGMFRRTANGTVINQHAKDILKYSLFDGVRNNENNAGAIYASMSKLDFFLTQYLAFINSTEEIVNGTKTKSIGKINSAVYSMRIGSDAPKIFFVRAPKYSDTQVKYALYNHVIDELNMFVNALNNIFTDEGGQLKTVKSVDKLFGRAYFDEKVANQIRKNKGTDYTSALINEKGELVGNMFNFGRLFELNGYSADKAIKSMLSLYGGVDANSFFIKDDDGRLRINPDRISNDSTNKIIVYEGNRFKLNLSDADKAALNNIVRTWCTIFLNESKSEIASYASMLTEYKIANDFSTLDNFLLNYVNMNINYDDLFEGDSKFYKDARDFLKRSKEAQAGGDAYAAYDMLEDPRTPIHEIEDEIIQIKTSKNGVPSDYVIPVYKNGKIVNDKLRARTGFRGVTIYNTVAPSVHADAIEEKLIKLLIKDGLSEEKAKERAKFIADGYRKPTKVNDAQSYITIEEFIRRRYADGTLSAYQDILAQLLDDNVKAEDIDLTEINARIQVQKNFYYDKVFDKDTGEYNPRQIKNAEFVLIPKLLPAGSQLRRVYDWMRANDIGQLNTAETSKAAKKHIFTIWDEQTGEFNEDFEKQFDSDYIEEYSYKYLYKQQDVPEHMKDAKNKAGTQFIKKIIDNIDRLDKSNEELNKVAEGFLKAYSANITDDFYTFIDDLGWVYDNNTGTFYNKEYATTDNDGNKLPKEVIEANRTRLNLDKFYERFREEAVRLGMDSNFMDYLMLTEAGQPIMPNFMNNTSSKLESIAQAMWNSAITRQTFPGWHCAQITDVGYDQKLNFDPETGVMEVYLPRWSNLIPKGKNAEEDAEILKQIHDEGLDIQIGYRIPTEGKQSISVLRVVGFVNDALGSTIVVPAEWVTQTGSDFDVDSIYGISWEMYQRKSKDGKITLHKIPFEEGKVTDEQLYINWVKERIDAKTNKSIFGEEVKDSLNELKKELNSLAFNKIDKLRNDLYTQLPNSCKKIIQDANDANKISKDGKKIVDIKAAYPIIISKLIDKAENLNEEQAAIVQEYIDYTKAILEIFNAQEGHKVYDVEGYKSKKAKIVEQLVKEAQDKIFKEIESKAIAEGLISFEEFKDLEHVKKLTRRARNNYIINAAITIMNDSSSREEQYSRSHFEDITNANKLIDDLTGDSLKKISPYNPLSQLDYFDDAMSGARMKARSVNWDTTFSKFNRVKAVLNTENEIEVILDDEEYDIETIKKSYEVKEVTQSENITEEESNIREEIDDSIGIENAKVTVETLESDNNELSDAEKEIINKELGNKPRVLIASEATDPVFHASKIKRMVNEELAKPLGQRRFHMMYLITKHDGLPLKELAELRIPKFIHFSITSLGGTKYEPGVMKMDDLLDRIEALIKDKTLNPNLITIRIDPIVPGVTKEKDIRHIIDRATKMGIRQFKFSVMDSYGNSEDRFVIQKMKEVGYDWDAYYSMNKNGKYAFHPKQEYIEQIYQMMDNIAEEYRINVWTCGEQPNFELKRVRTNVGCVNVESMNKAMGTTDIAYVRGRQRKDCSCYSNKVDALTYNDNCASSCLYCYAKHNGDATLQYYNEDGTLKDNNFTRTVRQATKKEKVDTKPKSSIKLNRLGWSTNNRNITGAICTPYIAQTTAHHLDAIKEGSIKNVNELTFGVYKLLVGLGLDYEHSIGFIRQPIITSLVENYKLTKSVYFKDTNDPIKMTMALIANQLRIKNKFKKDITVNDTLKNIIESLIANHNFTETFKEIYGIDISGMSHKDVLKIKLPLDKKLLFDRLNSNASETFSLEERYVIDFGILLMFNQFKTIADKIEDNIKVLSVDKIGNKTEIRETRLILDLLDDLRKNNIIVVNGVNIASAIFPINDKSKIEDESSAYQYIATVLKYVTQASTRTNTQIFITENEDFVEAEKHIESIIGKKLSAKEYKEYKKYYINYLYNRIEKLISPLTVNERGEIFIDNDAVNKAKENETYWNNERIRIVGYGIVKGPEIDIANINDPKEPELAEYKKLTPVQKVLFIQKHFNDEQGIFKFIKPTLVSGKDIAIKGISRQYMSFDDQIENIEDVYQLFINSFSNHNPLIKLAAIDLIKYAFIAEGFNFKSGYITKLIVNSSLYESRENGGLDIINGGNNTITEEIKDIPSILRSGELQDLYVRSHSDIVKIYRFGPLAKQRVDETTGALYTKNPNWTDTLLSHTDGDKVITLIDKPDDAHLHGIIRKLRLYGSAKYIRISVPDRAEHYTTILYKVVKKLINKELEYDLDYYNANKNEFKDMEVIGVDEQERKIKLLKKDTVFYLLPLDRLENTETFEYSYNQNYMQYFSQEYYLEKIQYLFEELQRTSRELRNAEVNTIDKIKPSFTQEEVSMVTDENLLMQLYNSGDTKLKASVRKFINDIEDYNRDVNKSGNYSSRIINNSYKALASYFPADTKVIQTITLSNGETIKIAISRFDLSKNNRRANFIKQYNGQLKLTDTDPKHKFDYIISAMKKDGTPPNFAELYNITIVPEFNDEVYSDTDEITSTSDLDLSARRADIDDVASSLIKDISYVYRRDELASGRRFLKELQKLNLDRNSLVSIQTNRDPIYRNAARYYRSVANAIIAKLNNYQVNETTSFAIDDPELYDYLVKHDELFPDVAKTILDAISFGSRIKEILNLNIAAEDEELAKSVNTIINAIKEVSQNNKLKRAMDNIFNIYFKKYSNNPEIIKDIIKLRETYGDTDQLYRWIADATEIANSEVQVILKQVYSLFSKAEMFDVKRNVDEWKKALKDINDMPGDLDISKFIDNNTGMLKQDFNEQFLIDREKVEDDFREAESELIIAFRDAYAKGDPIFKDIKGAVKKYIIAKWNRDNFLYKHTQQQIVPEYYREDLLNRKEAIESVGDLYFEFLSLRMQLYNTNFMPTETAEAAKERKERVQRRINSLLSSFDATDSLKDLEKQDKINHLLKIIQKNAAIREKYFDVQPYDGFMEEYKKYNDYLTTYNKNHSDESLEQKLENPKYKEAYDWIRTNGRIQFTGEAKTKLNDAYKVLLGRNSLISKKRREAFKRIPGLIDENGIIDATKFTDEQLEALKKEEQSDLSRMYEDGLGEGILIKQVPSNLPLFKKRKSNVTDGYILDELKGEDGALQMEIIAKINSILSKVIDRDTGKIIAPLLFNNSIVTDAERDELANLYSQLRKLKRSKTTKKKQDIYIEDVNRDDYLTMYSYAQTTLKGTRQYDQFLAIFQELDEDGNVSPNKLLYGFRIPTKKYEDVERTEAINFLNDNLEYVPTEYYIKARQEAAAKGPEEFDKWFKLNHIYDHYNHRYKPLNIWLESKPKADSYLAKEYKYTPTGDNMESSVKEEYINNESNNKRLGRDSKGYRRFSHNYKKGNPKYDSNLKLTEKERNLRDLIMATMRKFANTNATKRFVEEGYLPRERTTQVNGRWALEQGLGLMGLNWHSGRDSDIFRTEIDYSSDFEVDMPMLHLLKVKGSPEYLPYPSREGKSEEDYQKELKEVKEENKKIQATILATDNANMNTNWLDVMEDFIKTATIHNARAAAKPYIYLLLEDLKDNRAYMLKGMWNRQVVKSGDNAAFETEGYQTVSQKHTRELVHNMARRLLYDQHHENSLPRNIANFLQNMTSAKYMVFNLYGGIANVAIGKSGILSEELAGEYFGFNEFLRAEGEYLAHSVSIISSLYSDKANDLTTALMKKFNIVNVDDMIQLVGNAEDLDTRIEHIRSAMYSFQSIGEHYMQNSVLLAMLKSNRLYTDRFGNRRIGDFKDYTWDIEQEAMEAILSDYEYLATNYDIFRKNLKYETQAKYDISSGRKNINRMFLRSLKNSRNESYRGLYKEIVDKYIAKRKELLEAKKLEFKSNPTVESIFKYEDGYAVINPEILNKFNEAGVNKVGDLEKLLAEFKEKVKSVNRYIHGWYDKNAAGMIESKWYGSILMQYHKHLPIGILKRCRRRGFHSEFRGAKERGFYQTLIDFMGTEFVDYNDRVKAKTNEGTDIALASVQVIFESIINSVVDYQTNKELLAPWEKANLSRLGGGLGGALVACLITMALYGLYDDDELKNDRFKASLLYLADRLYADNTMYTPIGLVTEYRTAWSSPIASANGPSDLIKAMTIIPQYLFDPEFSRTYQTGLYKGKDKLQVLLRRNLPGVRPYDRIVNITRNNEYYKIGQSQLGINIAKNFGETLNEE